MKRLALLLLFALPLSAQQITQQPLAQTVQVGQAASFTVSVSGGPCRSLWLINGAGHYGSLASSVTYTFPSATLAQNGTTVQVQLYGCAGGGGSLLSSKVQLGVVAVVTLQSIAIAPVAPTIAIGQSQAFTAMGSYSDTSTKDISSSVVWASNAASIASFSGNVASGVGMGSAILTATSGTITGSTVLIVQPPITVSFSALYDDNSVPALQLIVRQIVKNADGTFTATPVLGLTPDATGAASGTFLLDPALDYDAMVVMNNVPIATPNFYSASALLALLPQISKVEFGVVLFKSTGLIKSYSSKAQ